MLYEVVEAPQSGAFAPVVTRGAARGIALTFDDGPTPGITDPLLAALERQHVPATFFVVGSAVRRDPALVRRMIADGDEVENHTDTHPHLNALSPARVGAEIDRAGATIAAVSGRAPRYLRPPFGARNAAVIAAARRRGLRVVLWNVMGPAERVSAPADLQRYARDLAARIRDGDIVLLHDGDRGRGDDGELAFQARTVPALVAALRARGERLVTLDRLLAAR